ncbi:MAG: V-type ATP synthase subunit B, partial [Candidatus Cloacimonadota bacterium]
MYKDYRTLTDISGPLLIIDKVKDIKFGELVEIFLPDNSKRRGQVLEVNRSTALIQVFEGTSGIDIDQTKVRFLGRELEIGVSLDMLGRVFDGLGSPIDGGPSIIPEERLDISGAPINPTARNYPNEFIQTGISSIDG